MRTVIYLPMLVALLLGGHSSTYAAEPPRPQIVEPAVTSEQKAHRLSLAEQVPNDPRYVAHIPSLNPQRTAERLLQFIAGKIDQTVPGFQVLPESGVHQPASLRLQICSDQYYLGPADGGTLSLTRQLLRLFPQTPVIAVIERKHLTGFLSQYGQWSPAESARLTLCPQDLPVAQWAQDNARTGRAPIPGGDSETVLLVPRYASRGETETTFVPGENFAAECLAAAGLRIAQSPLLFQGGNLLPVFDPRAQKTVLLVGEAEIQRNTIAGLSESFVQRAFQTEFGVDECVILPAASFHVDYEVSARSHEGTVIAFVNDSLTAHCFVVEIGLDCLREHDAVTPQRVAQVRAAIRDAKWAEAAAILTDLIDSLGSGKGQFPLSAAHWFSRGADDSGVGNLLRFIAACDGICSMAPSVSDDPATRDYLASLANLRRSREDLIAILAARGWTIVRVPSTSDDELSLNYLNGLHLPDQYLMPAYGGLYKPLDALARSAFEQALPKVKIVEVLCGESQRRNGALHCSVALQ